MVSPLFFNDLSDLRQWFDSNHATQTELLIGFYKKNKKQSSIKWVEAIEIALCYGWMDSPRKLIDENSFYMKLSPRSTAHTCNDITIKRIKYLINTQLITPKGLDVFKDIIAQEGINIVKEKLTLPPHYERLIMHYPLAWTYYNNHLSLFHKNRSIHWIYESILPTKQVQRLHEFIECCEAKTIIPDLRQNIFSRHLSNY